jgi:predicted dehydrogenase
VKLRAAVIGCGRIGIGRGSRRGADLHYSHAGAYHKISEIELVAAADIDPRRLLVCQKTWGVARLYRDYRQMLKAERPDIISICVPNKLHSTCLAHSIEVAPRAIFCEKPFTLNYDHAQQAVDQCHEKGIVLAVNHQRRWEPGHRRVAEMVQNNTLGAIQLVRGLYYGDWWNIGSHAVDLIRFFFGEPGSWQIAWIEPKRKRGFDVEFCISNGPRISLQRYTKNDAYQIFEWDVIGTRGRIQILNFGHQIKQWRIGRSAEYGDWELESDHKPIRTEMRSAFKNALRDVMRCIGKKREPACSGHDAAKTVGVLEAIADQARLTPWMLPS